MKPEIRKKIFLTILEGTAYSFGVVLLLYLTLPSDVFNPHHVHQSGGFARQFDGGCAGWTTSFAITFALTNLAYWWSYTTGSIVIFRLHPILKSVPESRYAVYLMCAFIFGCGATHLASAYATFNPVYKEIYFFVYLPFAVISMVGVYFIARSLIKAFSYVKARREQMDKLEDFTIKK